MDYEFIIKFLPLYKEAAILTLKIGIIGIIFAIIIGLIYYGLPKVGISIKAEMCAILGFNKLQTIIYIIMPQAIRVSLHGIIANIIFLLKETSVFSAISIMELMFTAKDLILEISHLHKKYDENFAMQK